MRILALEREPSSMRGGQELSLFDVCRRLAMRGHELHLLYLQRGDLLDGYREFCRQVTRVRGYAVDRTRTIASVARLVRDALSHAATIPDVIYGNQYQDSVFARALSWRFRRPFVCHVRIPPPRTFCGQYRWGMHGAVRLIATSQCTRQDYAGRGFRPERINVVYNGIDMAAFTPARSPEAVRDSFHIARPSFLVAYAGRVHPEKGIGVLIDAFARLEAPADLVLAGPGLEDGSGRDYVAEFREQARRRNVADRCHFVGHVASVADLFGAADVTVLPSLVAEGFGRVVIESMACGTPVVASDTGGIPEVLTGEFAEWLYPPGDHVALAAKLGGLRGSKACEPALRDRCRAHVRKRFNIEGTVAGVEAALQNTVDEFCRGRVQSVAGPVIR